MRIITGKYKGRHFDIPRTFKARPTTDFAKENIFNVINGYIDWEDTTALDLFSGTGSISLELLSRGCKQVVSVEKDRDHARFISQCMEKIGTEEHILIKGDVFRFLKSCHQKFDLIFADPPYGQGDHIRVLSAVDAGRLLAEGGLLILEQGADESVAEHMGRLSLLRERRYGAARICFYARQEVQE